MTHPADEHYNKAFGDKYAEHAMHMCWENHCQYPLRYSWPPSPEHFREAYDSAKYYAMNPHAGSVNSRS